MSERTAGYAHAIVALAEAEGELETVESELLTVARAVDANPELRDALTDIQLPVARRLGLLESDALQAAHPTTRSALAALIASDRAGDLMAVAQEVARQAAESRDRELAEVYVAVELSDGQRQALQEGLERATGKRLDLKVFVDASVVGGVRARIGDTVIDGSVARRLDEVKGRVAR